MPVEWRGHDDDDDCWVCDIKTAVRPDSFAVPDKPAPKRKRSDNKLIVKKEVDNLHKILAISEVFASH